MKHELLNTLTIMGVLLTEKKTLNRKKMRELVDFASLLVVHENLLRGEKPSFFIQGTPVTEFLETLVHIEQQKNPKAQIRLQPAKKNIFLQTDRHYLGEAMKHLMKKILKQGQRMIVQWSEQGSIDLLHEGERKICQIVNFKKLFSKKQQTDEIRFQLGLRILDLLGAKIEESRGKIRISFAKETTFDHSRI